MTHYYDDVVICTVCKKECFSTTPRWWEHVCWECQREESWETLQKFLEEYFNAEGGYDNHSY